jgi:hypothetical protein
LNNTKPIKDDVAKLLASKLNKKSQQQKLEENGNNTNDGQPEPTPMNTEFTLDSILLPVSTIDSANTLNIPNGNEGAVFIISNSNIENGHMFNNTISITKDNEIFISNYNKNDVGKLPKLVPISSHATETIAKCQKRTESSTDVSPNGLNVDKQEQKIEHISPKVFIIDKNNESCQKVQNDESLVNVSIFF